MKFTSKFYRLKDAYRKLSVPQFTIVTGLFIICLGTLILLVLFGASQSFLTPMGYQTNLMVYGPGRYRFFDIAKYGAGLTLIMSFTVPALIILNYG